jgi:hypothetical protein
MFPRFLVFGDYTCAEVDVFCVDFTGRATDYCIASMHVISALRGTLQPEMHVRSQDKSNTLAGNGGVSISLQMHANMSGTGSRHQRRLWVHVRDPGRIPQVQRLDGHQATQTGQRGVKG